MIVRTWHLILASSLLASAALAAAPISVGKNRLVVEVNGMVCSFCAHGAEKSLRELDCLDKSLFGDDGVLVEVDAHRITLALKEEPQVPIADIYERIRKAGYDPIAMHVRTRGKLVKAKGKATLKTSGGQRFALTGKLVESLAAGPVEIQGHLNASSMKAARKGIPTVVVDRAW